MMLLIVLECERAKKGEYTYGRWLQSMEEIMETWHDQGSRYFRHSHENKLALI